MVWLMRLNGCSIRFSVVRPSSLRRSRQARASAPSHAFEQAHANQTNSHGRQRRFVEAKLRSDLALRCRAGLSPAAAAAPKLMLS